MVFVSTLLYYYIWLLVYLQFLIIFANLHLRYIQNNKTPI
ncbi:hypothetical protein HMPREF0663_10242 [Hoylesella oralis ATCC 33269]|uniref:Uncharacterized protein n=1 Tax=Hoylesella oralis ATCC 33269 TaxID=873533 RepID=E7RM92_9BACT|nr:hypothetical protein HMPREF0663_10242 [Hoylesella oralis ATCC 33269]